MLHWGLRLGYTTQKSTVCLTSEAEKTSSYKLKAQRGSHSNKQTKWGVYIISIILLIHKDSCQILTVKSIIILNSTSQIILGCSQIQIV